MPDELPVPPPADPIPQHHPPFPPPVVPPDDPNRTRSDRSLISIRRRSSRRWTSQMSNPAARAWCSGRPFFQTAVQDRPRARQFRSPQRQRAERGPTSRGTRFALPSTGGGCRRGDSMSAPQQPSRRENEPVENIAPQHQLDPVSGPDGDSGESAIRTSTPRAPRPNRIAQRRARVAEARQWNSAGQPGLPGPSRHRSPPVDREPGGLQTRLIANSRGVPSPP